MAKRYRNRLESLAESMLELRYKEMVELGESIIDVFDASANHTDPNYWARILLNWASATEQAFNEELQASKGE